VLEVEGCDYQRLEVSSPGLDRPLKKVGDYRRFAGEQVELTLKLPLQGRKKYRGELQALGDAWRLILPEGGGVDATQRVLDFEVAEVREARLVPVLDFKGRRLAAKGAAGSEPAAGQGSSTTADGAKRGAAAGRSRAGEKTDGGGIQ
jgi:ribosome maturation factor RimP